MTATKVIHRLVDARSLCEDGRGRAIRERANISARELAGALDVRPSTLSRWERGLQRPRLAAALRWHDTLLTMSSRAGTAR